MKYRGSLPELRQLSIVTAVIMLAFALIQLVAFPVQLFSFSVFGIILDFVLDFSTVITLLTSFLAAAGMDWLIQTHPEREQYQTRWAYIRHWILPVLTTLVIGVSLNTFAWGPFWWVIFGLGSLLLIAVLIAEYNVVTGDDIFHPLATVGLTGLSFALYLLLCIAVYAVDLRLYIRLLILGIGVMMVISRSLFLRLGQWHIVWAGVSSLIVLEIIVGLHYLPLSPTQFGLLVVGVAYGLTSIVTAIKESRTDWEFWAEPVVMMVLLLFASLVVG